jgi:hypothetical protein
MADTEFVIILAIAICAGLLTFIALTISSISNDLFRIKQILNNHEREQTEQQKKEYIETGKITH